MHIPTYLVEIIRAGMENSVPSNVKKRRAPMDRLDNGIP
jgi:hypothetical protein